MVTLNEWSNVPERNVYACRIGSEGSDAREECLTINTITGGLSHQSVDEEGWRHTETVYLGANPRELMTLRYESRSQVIGHSNLSSSPSEKILQHREVFTSAPGLPEQIRTLVQRVLDEMGAV